jgi:L-threonylcarbamoyladenylate synthase
MSQRIHPPDPSSLGRATDMLRAGELVAFPTETVYGLGADALNPEAVARIFAAKGRPADHPLIVHLPQTADLGDWARDIPVQARLLSGRFWPGPLTLILKRHARVPDAVTGGQDTVGLRIPSHPVAQTMLGMFGSGVAAPSANRYGRISPTRAAHVAQELGPEQLAMILDGGPSSVGIESTIVDLSGDVPRILRPGHIRPEQIAEVLEIPLERLLAQSPAVVPRVSGSHAAHYAPRTPLRLVETQALASATQEAIGRGQRLAVFAPTSLASTAPVAVWADAPAAAEVYAQVLYDTLRHLDETGVDLILVALPPTGDSAWQAIHDRLRRAQTGSGVR